MEITDVRVVLHSGGKLRAFVSVTFDNAIVVRGIKVIETQERTFVAMPSRDSRGKQTDVCHPTNQETRAWLEETILAAFKKVARTPEERPSDRGGRGTANQLNVH